MRFSYSLFAGDIDDPDSYIITYYFLIISGRIVYYFLIGRRFRNVLVLCILATEITRYSLQFFRLSSFTTKPVKLRNDDQWEFRLLNPFLKFMVWKTEPNVSFKTEKNI